MNVNEDISIRYTANMGLSNLIVASVIVWLRLRYYPFVDRYIDTSEVLRLEVEGLVKSVGVIHNDTSIMEKLQELSRNDNEIVNTLIQTSVLMSVVIMIIIGRCVHRAHNIMKNKLDSIETKMSVLESKLNSIDNKLTPPIKITATE